MEKEQITSKLKYLNLIIRKISKKYELYKKEKDEENKDTIYLALSKLIEELIETSTNINNLLLEENGDFAESYYLSFIKLKDYYDIDSKFLKKIAMTSRLRNKVVHNYSSLEEELTIDKIEDIVKIYIQYKDKILKILN